MYVTQSMSMLKNSPLPSFVQSILKVLLVQPLLYVVKQGVAGSVCKVAVWVCCLACGLVLAYGHKGVCLITSQ